ncbi:RNA polymerase sigma factor [candidate division CSSED10-310 bacterium]|uniref:RNA polymerase sigma factor n=1 Tax=candidate division CSSED10-310 bacterium TaxID=2855610 RepID=A0ABV6Z155_UNCC1
MDEETLKSHYQQYGHLVYKRAREIVRNEEDARDIVQTVFYRIWKYGDKFGNRSDIFSWIYRITTNCSFDLLKKRVKYNKEVQLDEANIPTWDDSVLQVEQRDFLLKKLASFDKTTRQIVFLYYIEELTQQEIADFMKISRKTVGKKIKNFKKKVKEV